ncbi:MAG: glycosyltransferase family 2 protein [Lachnospiraceae bacterium]|nr:glycosyltransferase family 2 protein [Lachnospiraceae bacterium]
MMTELTILIPCLDEAQTVAACVGEAKRFIEDNGIEAEVLVVDNGSTDGSGILAADAGARVVFEPEKGYGNALITGTKNAHGKYVIMGDADGSYDLYDLMPILEKLRAGYELVMGDRFAGGIESGAMPTLHRYIGNPLLSAIGRGLYHSQVRDFHCGLRGYDREALFMLGMNSPGFEYASEMVARCELAGYRIGQVPIILHRDGRTHGHSHIHALRDGLRHLKVLIFLKCGLPPSS